MSWKKTLVISVLILAAGAAVTGIIFSTEPTAKKTGATKETAMLVDVTTVQRGDFRPTIQVMGTVRPSQDITLSPRVGGQIIDRSPSFTPGGYVDKGDTLLQIDPADYRNLLEQRESELRQAKADLNIEQGRQQVARQEYKLIGDTLPAPNEALVLRKPQLESARSKVESARAAVEQARLQLQRTTIEAPFDAHILSRNANIGSQVAPGDDLGRLVGLEHYWVEATVPLSHLPWLSFPDQSNERGSEVRIRNRTAWEEGKYRTGYLYKLVGTLEDETRMAKVLISVPDPHAYHADNSDKPILMIGAFVEAHLQADKLNNVVRLNRDYIRQDETVWVMKEGKLQVREVDTAFRDARYAYIRTGLKDNEQVVTTNLATVTDGAPLRLQEEGNAASTDSVSNASN